MSNIQESITSILQERNKRKHLAVIVCMIAAATVLAVFWSLHIKGITMSSGDLICGMEEHTHTSDCYAWIPVDEDTEDGSELEETESVLETEESTEKETEADSEIETVSETEASGTEAVSETVTESATESVLNETGTESLTEDGSEALTEEETEIPQVGDTKIIDGVEYVYTLICGMEEHTHTDECYADENSEETETEETANVSSLTAGVTSLGVTRLGSSGPSSGVSAASVEEEGNSGIATVSEEGSEEETEEETGTISLLSSSAAYNYYYGDPITLADVYSNVSAGETEDYIIYTIIDGTYYALTAEGNLVECKYGLYPSSNSLQISMLATADYFDAMRWNLTLNTTGNVTNMSSGIYDYYIQNATYGTAVTGQYLAPSTTETISSDDTATGENSYAGTSSRYEMSGDGTMIFTIQFTDDLDGTDEFWVELYDNDGKYITTSSVYYGWTVNGGTALGGVEGTSGTVSEGDTYVVTVTREGTEFLIVYYGPTTTGGTTYEVKNTIYVTGSGLATDINLHVISQVGEYKVSAQYAELTVTSASITQSTSSVDISGFAADRSSEITLSGDFDVTYTFDNETTDSSEQWNNFIVELHTADYNSSGTDYTYITVRADNAGWLAYQVDSSSSLTFETDTTSYDWSSWISSIASDSSCTVRVVRTGNTFIIYTTAGGETFISYTTCKDFDGQSVVLYLTGEDCRLSNINMTESTAGLSLYTSALVSSGSGSTVSYTTTDAYARYSTTEQNTVMTAASDGYGWTAYVKLDSNGTYYLYGEENTAGVNSSEWGTSPSASTTSVTGTKLTDSGNAAAVVTTFYLAQVREYTVWFDATNDGNGMYSGNAVIWHTDMYNNSGTRDTSGNYASRTYADSDGICYVNVPYAYMQSVYNGLAYGSKYPYVLQGWFDIYGNSAASDGTACRYYSFYYYTNYRDWDSIDWTARPYFYWEYTAIQISDDTVFYADWVPLTYDINSDSNGNIADDTYLLADADSDNAETYDNGDTKGGVDTSNFITTNVFDYNELINYWSTNIIDEPVTVTLSGVKTTVTTTLNSSSHVEVWAMTARSSTDTLLGKSSWGFVFMNGTTGYPLYSVTGRDTGNGATQTQVTQGLTTRLGSLETEFLEYLFGTDNAYDVSTGEGVLGKTYVGEGNYLFQYSDSTGYYYYDAKKNAATYNQTNQRFYLYDGTIMAIADSGSDFLPFNYELLGGTSKGNSAAATSAINPTGESSSKYIASNSTNYWFGMSTDISFYLPQEIGTTDNPTNTATTGDNMVFKFLGDDDVWVFVDDVLVLDLGGIHGECYGEIDFSTGMVRIVNAENIDYVDTDSTVIGISESAYDTNGNSTVVLEYKLSELLGSNYSTVGAEGTHTLTMNYLERGGSQSNAAIYFNIAPVYTVKLAKVVASSSGSTATYAGDGVTFDVYTSSDFENSTPIDTVTTKNSVLTINELVPGTIYYLVETNAPTGYPLSQKYITVYADSAGSVTVCVYSSSGELIETLSCVVGENDYNSTDAIDDIIISNDYSVFGLTTASSGDGVKELLLVDGTDGSNTYLLNNLSVFGASNTTYGTYLIATMTYANYEEYELPSAGSTGITKYLLTGETLVVIAIVGLILIAFYQFVWLRRLRTMKNNEEYTGEKSRRSKNFARMRGHPRERSITHGHARDRPGDR